MSETVKCTCTHCGAKYRLPIEYQGRSARCKKCNEKFQIPAEKSVEDSVLDWLSDAGEDHNDTPVEKPRVRSMVDSAGSGNSGSSILGNTADAKKPVIRRKAE